MDRILLQNLLPKEGTFQNLKLLREAREMLSFTEEENRLLAFSSVGPNQVAWRQVVYLDKETGTPIEMTPENIADAEANPGKYGFVEAVPPKEFEFGDVVIGLIVKEMQDLDVKEKLTDQHFGLFEAFIGVEENESSQ